LKSQTPGIIVLPENVLMIFLASHAIIMLPVNVLLIFLASLATVHVSNLHIEETNIRKK